MAAVSERQESSLGRFTRLYFYYSQCGFLVMEAGGSF